MGQGMGQDKLALKGTKSCFLDLKVYGFSVVRMLLTPGKKEYFVHCDWSDLIGKRNRYIGAPFLDLFVFLHTGTMHSGPNFVMTIVI